MAEGNVDLRFIGQQLQRVQCDLRELQTDQKQLRTEVQADWQEMRGEVRALRGEIGKTAANLDAFREGVADRFEQAIQLVKDTSRSLDAKIDRLLPPK
jgi:DNA repair ATPase RecN